MNDATKRVAFPNVQESVQPSFGFVEVNGCLEIIRRFFLGQNIFNPALHSFRLIPWERIIKIRQRILFLLGKIC